MLLLCLNYLIYAHLSPQVTDITAIFSKSLTNEQLLNMPYQLLQILALI